MRRRFSPISVVLVAVLVLIGQASAAPTPVELSNTKGLFPRQGNGNPPAQPFTTQTVQTTQTDAGPVTETCTLTFTPVTGANGQPLVQVVRSCTMSVGAPPPPPGVYDDQLAAPEVYVFTASGVHVYTAPTNIYIFAPSFQLVDHEQSHRHDLDLDLFHVDRDTPSSSQTSQSSSPVDTSTASPETAPDTTPTPAASSAAQGAFQIPGKKISVLPIGLGIFAGISVIALIVVGLVTYERTKYRKIFRQRKLAEQGAGPGYGGTGS
ncbi:hypothetical protein EDB87DRAFT_1212461 [Lactarius vividus]|nr:hypothetical protein EDB87DRAFT_1212461 [Lactarius vividus]